MKKEAIINQFNRSLIVTKQRKNQVKTHDITSTLILAATNMAFVNESCKSSGKVSKSQVIYRKLKGVSIEEIQECFQKHSLRFLKMLKLFSRNRRFIISFDTTKEAFYGDYSKAEDYFYLHSGSIAKESEYYYEFLTVAITCGSTDRYILDGRIVEQGCYIEDYVSEMVKFVKDKLPLELILFDRGFTSWAIIFHLKALKVPYMIFWRKNGNWYEKDFSSMKDGECKEIQKKGNYHLDKTTNKVSSNFVLIKQHRYKNKKYNWIFATNVKFESAEAYVKRYKKRWGIETIYRVTDDIRAYTTSTKAVIRCFLFMITCFVYNIWRCFQMFLGESFTLANFKCCIIILLAKIGRVFPNQYLEFENIGKDMF